VLGIERAVTKNDRFDLFHFLRPNFAKAYRQPLPVDLHTPEDCGKSIQATAELLLLVAETGRVLVCRYWILISVFFLSFR
jgi:hypothetical protein